VEQTSKEAAGKAAAFANGLRRSIASTGRRWAAWPGGADALASVLARIDVIGHELQLVLSGEGDEAWVAACFSDLRTILEWSTYQSAALATARALLFARKTRSFVERLGLLDSATTQAILNNDSEESLIENVQTKNAYMQALADKHPHLELPASLVRAESLVPKIEKKPGTLDLIMQLKKTSKKAPGTERNKS
jgi:hypothetical protein